MKGLSIRTLLAGAALSSAMALSSAAGAAEFRVVIPAQYGGDADALTAAIGRVFAERVGPGDALVVQDGTADKRIAKISVPEDERFEVVRRKMRKFSGEIARIAAFLESVSEGGDAPGRLDLLSVLRGPGDDRITGSGEAVHVLVVGSPVQAMHDPAWSMVGEDGTLRVPTDTAMLSSGTRTPYSVTARAEALTGTYVHMCGGGARLNRLNDMALRHVWSTWTAAQGGTLATWTDDLAVCAERFAAAVTEPLEVAAPDTSLPPAMMRPVWNESERADETHRPQPKSFNVFFNAPHPSVEGLIVYTGVEYDPADYPARYDNAWCYYNSVAGREGIQVRISVGRKQYGRDPVWHDPSGQELEAAGLTREDAERARAVCRFPGGEG